MIERKGVETRASNTGSGSQIGFTVGPDWVTVIHDRIQSGSDVIDLISALESLAGDQIDFCENRPRFDNHKNWAGSGRSQKGLLLWYNPPCSGADPLLKSLDGNLISHPGLLPSGHFPVTESAADYIRSQLPSHARLHYDATPAAAFDPSDGSEYQHHGYSIVAADGEAIDSLGELRLSMSGRYLDNVEIPELAAYLGIIGASYGLRCSRFDVALNDHEKRFPLELVEQARRDRNYFNVITTSVVNSDNIHTNVQGETIYFGSRTSDAFMRVYDMTAESGGVRIGNRWEVELHGKKADLCLSQWLTAMQDDESRASRLLVNVVLGTVDFRDKSKGDKNRKRCPVLPWFDEMCNMLKALPVRLRVAKPKQSLQQTIDYLKRSVAPSLASMVKALGAGFDGYFRELVSDGERRMSNVRRKICEDVDISQLCY
jgi:hypothetical protein